MNNNLQANKYHKLKNNKRLNNVSKDLVKVCNNILTKRDKHCNCFNRNSYPSKNYHDCIKKKRSKKCENYNKCKKLYSLFSSGYEPSYNPDDWSDPLIEGSHNCYMYFLNDKKKEVRNQCLKLCKDEGVDEKTCLKKKQSVCGKLKPQPGNYAYSKGYLNEKKKVYSCKNMVNKVLKDNWQPELNKSKIEVVDFTTKCPRNHYKGALVVDPGNTYHFYRQDNNLRFSHKQGTLRVENIDSDGKPIYAPHLSGRNYSAGRTNGINYLDHCAYMCIPNNYYSKTNAMGK